MYDSRTSITVSGDHDNFFSFPTDLLSKKPKVAEAMPAAFSMLEKIKMPDNPGCLSSFTNWEDRSDHTIMLVS